MSNPNNTQINKPVINLQGPLYQVNQVISNNSSASVDLLIPEIDSLKISEIDSLKISEQPIQQIQQIQYAPQIVQCQMFGSAVPPPVELQKDYPVGIEQTNNQYNNYYGQSEQIQIQSPISYNSYAQQPISNYYQQQYTGPIQQQMNYNYNQNVFIPNMMSNNVYPTNQAMSYMQPQISSLKLLRPKDKDKKIVAVIVSFCNGCTYDNLFTTMEQKTLEGTQVLVYSCDANYLPTVLKAFEEPPTQTILQQFMENIKGVDPDCVVFNWECSSSYSSQNFTEGKQVLFKFVKKMLDAGHMTMFSDFSLKALIKEWDSQILGKNPFEKIGETSSEVVFKFESSVLKECPSAQLQLVGDMAEGGKVKIHCLGGTILYSVNTSNIDKQHYSLQVLTVNITNLPERKELILNVAGTEGSAGHILLKFKSGGMMLTSMGHWIELMKVDTSQKKLFEVAEREYGAVYAAQMKSEYANMDNISQKAYIQRNAVEFIQQSAPCYNMNKKC